MDATKVGKAIVRLADEQGEGLFLLARVITAQLRREPIDTSTPRWEIQLAGSVEAAFHHDLARIPPLSKDDAELPQAAGELLAALAWGYGAGLPDDIWPIMATALSPTNVRYDRDDVFWVLGHAGGYIVEDGEAGRAVYRLSHQRLADHLRRTVAADSAESAQEASRLAIALVNYYQQLLTIGRAPAEPAYLWRYAWRHAADGGLTGIDALRRLADHDRDSFLPHLALALNDLGVRYAEAGRRVEAVAPAEEAVSLHQELAAANAAFLPALAMVLGNLGNRYSEVGRSQEAVAPAQEAVSLYRQLAAASPAFLPDLAKTLGNLGNRYSEVGRSREAVAPAEEAVSLLRELARDNPQFLPDLARNLNNLGTRHSEVGRPQEAVAPAEEAVGLFGELAPGDPRFLPDFAMALNNLGGRYRDVGRLQEGVARAEEAVDLYRELARGNPRFLPDFAMALGNLGIHYSEVGRPREAVAPAEEAVGLYREVARGNPRFLPDLARNLGDLGARYSEVGRPQEAVALTEEAVGLYREVARGNPRFLPSLAGNLNNLGARYTEVGRLHDAVASAEEATDLFREVASDNPRFLPDVAMALDNLGLRYSEVGRPREAVAPAEEAVGLYREVARGNPRFLPNLAMALGNFGSHYTEVGRLPEAVALTEEAVDLYREVARGNPRFLPNLAGNLNNLGARYSEVGRPQDAVAPAEEATDLFREAASDNPRFLPDVAMALGNLGSHYSKVGRLQEAVALTEEAVNLHRELARGNPGLLPNLAIALNNLSTCYREAGQQLKAVAPAEESVSVFRGLARGNPRFLPSLAIALSNLGNPYSEAERSDAIENWWDETISSLPSPRSKAFILLRRARSRNLTDPSAIDDLLAAQALITDSDDDLIADLHNACRTHRAHDPHTFDSRWRHKDGLLPQWLLIDEVDLELMWRWITSSSETAAKQFLTEHAEALLIDSSELVLDEIALRLPDRSMIELHRQLLREARRVGVDEAYRPRLAAELLRTWLRATLEAKQAMLREQQTRVELLAPEVANAFQTLRNADPDNTALVVHQALLALARADHDDIAFKALAEPERFPALLAELARADEQPALDAMATLAAIAGATDAEQASGWFHKAIALALAEDPQAALNAARHARRLDASQLTTWLALLVELAGRHPNVIPLTQALAETT